MDEITKSVFDAAKDKGKTIAFLADKTKIPYQVLAKCSQGKRKLRADEFFLVCAAAELDPNEYKDKLPA